MRACLFAILAMSLLAEGPAAADPPAGLAGTWVFSQNGASLTLALESSGAGSFNGAELAWRATRDTLSFELGGQSMSYQYVLRGDSLQLSGGDLPQAVTFRRQASGGKPVAIAGTWVYTQGQVTLTLELGPGSQGKLNGQPLTWQYAGGTLTLSQGEVATSYQASASGDTLQLAGGDLAGPIAMKRKGTAAAAAAPAASPPGATGIAGVWIYSGNGEQYTLELKKDGSGALNGQPFTWKYAGTTLTVVAAGQSTTYQAVVRDSSLDVSGGNLPAPATLHRQGTEPAAAAGNASGASGVAGVYSATESSIDPSIVMIISQYITLWPDGTVSWSKTEGGASRTQVTANTERFRSWHQGGAPAGNAGRWESDGHSIIVRWRYWNNLVSRGEVDLASGRFSLTGMGILEEGKTLVYKRN